VNLFAAKLSRFLLGSFSCRATAVISLLYGRQMRSDSRKCAELRARFISTFEYVIVTLPGGNATSFRGQKERRGPLLYIYLETHTHTHTHTHPFNGPFPGTTRVNRYQKGKTNLDFTEARDSEWQWHQLGHMQVCTSLQTDNHTSAQVFLQAGCPSYRPTNSVKAL